MKLTDVFKESIDAKVKLAIILQKKRKNVAKEKLPKIRRIIQ